MGNNETQGVPSETVNPVLDLLDSAREHHSDLHYADRITVVQKDEKQPSGVKTVRCFDAGVYAKHGLMCIIVEACEALDGFTIMSTTLTKAKAAAETPFFPADPKAKFASDLAKEMAKDAVKNDKALAVARVKAFCQANYQNETYGLTVMAMHEDAKAFVKHARIFKKDATSFENAIIATIGATDTKPTKATWKQVKAILHDIDNA